jgi:hypothetical protein
MVCAEPAALPLIPWPQEIVMGKGGMPITGSSRILYTNSKAQPIAKLFAEEISRTFGVTVKTAKGIKDRPGDILLIIDTKSGMTLEEYQLKADKSVVLKAAGIDGLYAGTATLLQAIKEKKGKIGIPAMTIKDKPSREFRAHMIDMKNQWHSLEDLKQFVDLCRFYKARYFSLHSGEGQWIGALTGQTGKMTPEERRKHCFYSKKEMDELIAYASSRGVYMFPHNECTPHFGHMVNAMKKDYVSSDSYKGFADELDGKGAYAYTGKADDRWMKLMKIAVDKAIDQFAVAYPDGKLPYYHIGPVHGEGGMGSGLAAQFLKYITDKSPDTKMMFWNGISASDKNLAPHKDKCVIAYYDDEFGASDMASYLKEGWPLVNAAWSPLYVVGNGLARPVEKVFNDWNLIRQGSDGVPGGYGAVTWEKVTDLTTTNTLLGGMLCTWETHLKYHFERVRVRVPAFVEHAWHNKPWPYPADDYAHFEKRLFASNKRLSQYLVQPEKAPNAPLALKASQGTAKGKVRINWRSGGGTAPTGYRLLRGTSTSVSSAEQITPDLPLTTEQYMDTSVEPDTQYYYWVKAFNDAGESECSEMMKGSAGSGKADIKSYEPFNYSAGSGIDGKSGGTGWKNAWKIPNGKSLVKLDSEGLSYVKLAVSGGSLRMHPVEDKKGVQLLRDITGKMGMDETTMWMSFLVRANKVGDGHLFLLPNRFGAAEVGKVWGRSFGIFNMGCGKNMENGKTYFVVARYDFGEGDTLAMWINPPLDSEPDVEKADKMIKTEIGSGSALEIQLQGWGQGDYNLDEIRFGSTWKEVGGLGSAKDTTPPNPSPMTWIGPPSLEKDGSVYMAAVTATDPSDVEYYFECVSGGGKNSGWQDTSEYRVEGLQSGTYSYRAKARDKSANQNETEWSFEGKVEVK